MMAVTVPCLECSQPMREDMERCPHCWRPGLYPGVSAARRPEEQAALQQRYEQAFVKARGHGMEAHLREYEAAVARSDAVIGMSFATLQRFAWSEEEMYRPYYEEVAAGARVPGGDTWDRLRAAADALVLGQQNRHRVCCAALTIKKRALANDGECSLLLREEMIAHRASVFEENTVLFMHRHNLPAGAPVPAGCRAVWADRALLAVAKTGGSPTRLGNKDYAGLLQHPAGDARQNHLIEVHIHGPLTLRAVRAVVIRAWQGDAPPAAHVRLLTEKLAQFNIPLTLPATP